MSDERLSDQDLHSCTYIMTLTLMLTKSVQSLLPSTRGRCFKGASFTSRIQVHGKGPRNYIYNVQPGGRGCGGCVGEVICHKKVQQSFLNQSLDPPIKNSWIRPCNIYILLTKREGRTGRISARGLDSTDRA